ncbi:MAG: hypothetical protein II838_11275 [Lachnospiraceae bacterium]|nr:hypothetical protein [Lachnospiraceae bacterium]
MKKALPFISFVVILCLNLTAYYVTGKMVSKLDGVQQIQQSVQASNEEEVKEYMTAWIDVLTDGKIDEYCEKYDVDKTMAKEEYSKALNTYIEQLKGEGLVMDKESEQKFRDFCVLLVSKIKCEVKDVKKDGLNYLVDLEVKPIVYDNDKLAEECAVLEKKARKMYLQKHRNSRVFHETEFARIWCDMYLEYLTKTFKKPIYGEAKTVTLTLIRNGNAGYSLDEEGVANLKKSFVKMK